MILSNQIYDLLLIGGIAFLLTLISFFNGKIKGANKKTRLWHFTVISVLPTTVIVIAVLNYPEYFWLSWISVVIMFLIILFVIRLYDGYEDDGILKVFSIIILPMILLIPNTFYWFDSNKEIFVKEEKLNTGDFELKKLEASFEKIKVLNKDLELNIATETEYINQTMEEIYVEIKSKKEELQKMRIREAQYKAETEYYKRLANLSQPEIDAVINSLNKGKWEGYIVGAFLGFLANLLASAIIRRKPLRKILGG